MAGGARREAPELELEVAALLREAHHLLRARGPAAGIRRGTARGTHVVKDPAERDRIAERPRGDLTLAEQLLCVIRLGGLGERELDAEAARDARFERAVLARPLAREL